MNMHTYDEILYLEISFGEALERFSETDPKEVAISVKRSKKAKPPGDKLKPPGGIVESQSVVRLAGKRKPGGR